MSINEGWRPSNLTEKEQREAMRAIYGLGERDDNMTPSEWTYEERQRLRRMLDAEDQKQSGGHKEFDLNKPPAVPYVYREYPMMMFNHKTGANKLAHNYDERQQMKMDGWTEDSVPPNHQEPAPPPEIDLTPEERAEVVLLDSQLTKKKK